MPTKTSVIEKCPINGYNVLCHTTEGLKMYGVLASSCDCRFREDGRYDLLFSCGDDSMRFDGVAAWINLNSTPGYWLTDIGDIVRIPG